MHPSSSKRPFHLMAKPAGPACNLSCLYCFYLSRWDGGAIRGMDDATLEHYVSEYIASHPGPEVPFAWQGGEPTLMGIDFFRRAIALQKRYLPPGWTATNSLQTNGVLLNDAWCQFLTQEKFLVGISLDGPPKFHDRRRLDRGGNPTAERVLKSIELMRKHKVEYNILCVVGSHNAGNALQVYRFLRSQGTQFLQFIPVVERRHSAATHDFSGPNDCVDALDAVSLTPEAWGKFLITVFNEWVTTDVGSVYIRDFDNWLGLWVGLPSTLCIHAVTCGDAMVIEADGSIYSCDHFVYPTHRLGRLGEHNLLDMISSSQQKDFGTSKRNALPTPCHTCKWRTYCNGGCPKQWISTTPESPKAPHLCGGWKIFFTHAEPAFDRMAKLLEQKQAPAAIMSDRSLLRSLGLTP